MEAKRNFKSNGGFCSTGDWWRRVRFVLFWGGMLVCSQRPAEACDSLWQYIGHPPWEGVSWLGNHGRTDTVYWGTGVDSHEPTSGGVYRRIASDTIWDYAGLGGITIYELRQFDYCRPERIFAVGNYAGLFVSEDDTTWSHIYSSGGLHVDFATSRFDTSLWATLTNNDGFGSVLLSRNSGQSWSAFWTWYTRGFLMFSNYFADRLYYSSSSSLVRLSLADSTMELVQNFAPDAARSVFYHPEHPWIYTITRRTIGRYNESTSDTIARVAPAEIASIYEGAYDLQQQALLIGTSAGLYHVSADLAHWEPIQTHLPTQGWRVYVAGEGGCIAGNWDSLYEAREGLGVIGEGVRGSNRNPALSIYPNPTSDFLELNSTISGTFEIFDLLGRLVDRKVVLSNLTHIDLTAGGLATGSYYYRFAPFYGIAPINSTGVIQFVR
jgi:hypothetical protein